MSQTVTIKRIEAPESRGFAKNGNVATQAMSYKWQVIVKGKLMATESRLKDAKDAATYYGSDVTVVR
jgi:hypothetical protein